jgi:hypothetical protein
MRHAARDDLLDIELRCAKGRQRPENLAGDRRVVGRLRGLQLVGIDDDVIDQHARHAHVMRLQRAVLHDALHLRDDDAAIVARGQRLLQAAEIGALVLIGQVAALVRRGGADDRDIRRDGRKIQPLLALELLDTDNRLARGAVVHGAALLRGSTNVSRPTLVSTPGRFAAASRCMSNRMPDGML